jgi:hypothetical protein
MRAAAILDVLERPPVVATYVAPVPSARVARIARTIAEMRAAAGLPG